MTTKEIERELNGIYKTMDNWYTENKEYHELVPQVIVARREGVLYIQQALYRVLNARKSKNKILEYFSLADYYSKKAEMLLSENAKNN